MKGEPCRLTPVSMAFFSKPNSKGEVEINTIRAATATLVLDKPISGPLDMGKRRIVAAELHGTGEPSEGDDQVADRALRFKLTEKSMISLGKAGVPEAVLARLGHDQGPRVRPA